MKQPLRKANKKSTFGFQKLKFISFGYNIYWSCSCQIIDILYVNLQNLPNSIVKFTEHIFFEVSPKKFSGNRLTAQLEQLFAQIAIYHLKYYLATSTTNFTNNWPECYAYYLRMNLIDLIS